MLLRYRLSAHRASLAAALLAGAVATAAGRTGNYLIVTASSYVDSGPLNQLIAAKTAQGLTVQVYPVAVGTSNTAIRTYVRSLWGTAGAPNYLLIVGDTDGATATAGTVPSFTGTGTKGAPTDLPYTCMDADPDWHPEFPVGRFSVRNVATLQAVVDKTLTVESGVFVDPSYTTRAAFLATEDSDAQAEATHEYCISNYLDAAAFESIRIYAAQGGDTADVTAAVDEGVLLMVYIGHSSQNGWWSPSFVQANVNALSNAGLYGLVFGFSCDTASFPALECFGETWLRAPNKGAAAYLSASTFIYYGGDAWESSRRLEKYFFRAIFERQIWEVGPAWQAGMADFLADPYFTDEVKHNVVEMFVLLGDPSLALPHLPPSPIPVARVRAPNGGEQLTVGQQYDVKWSAGDDIAVTAVDLALSADGGATFPYVIATDLANTGTYTWTVPAHLSTRGRVRVIAHDGDGNTGEDTSDADFVITQFVPQLVHQFNLDTNPGWTTQGQWAYGHPRGGGGDPSNGHTGSNVYGYNLSGQYPNNMPRYYLTTTAINCTGVTGTALRFWRWLGVESSTFDHAGIEASHNGTTWTSIWENMGDGVNDTAWHAQAYDISAIADNQSTVYIRWAMGTSDSMVTYCGWNVDDIEIWGIVAPDVCRADCDCDGAVGFSDIDYFVAAIPDNETGWGDLYAARHSGAAPPCLFDNCDANGDGHVNFADIDVFVALIPSACP